MSALVLSEVLVMTVIDCLHLYPVLIIVLFSIQLQFNAFSKLVHSFWRLKTCVSSELSRKNIYFLKRTPFVLTCL